MSVAPVPAEIYRRAVVEGRRRLGAGGLELVATGFNAGFTIAFGVATLGIVRALVAPALGEEIAHLAGAAGFAIGLVFLVVSRAELFTENFFDPVAAVIEDGGRRAILRLVRLWAVIVVLNLVGGSILVLLLSIDGVLPRGAEQALVVVAEEIAARSGTAAFGSAVVGGALVTLLSFLLQAVDRVIGRIVAAYLVGFVLAVGTFAHVVVTAEHLLAGLLGGASVGAVDLATGTGIAIAGNLLGGIAFVTLAHVAQARARGG